MKTNIILTSALLAGAMATTHAPAANAPAAPAQNPATPKPNFLIILLDDSGFSDFGCYGSQIPTPNIDALAQHGVRMSQMYNCARCCPTRASLLTGLYPQQAGVGYMISGMPRKGREQFKNAKKPLPASYQGYLNNHCVTLAEVLNAAGYYTAQVGKWHVGAEHNVTPVTRGFTRSLTCNMGGGVYYDDARPQSLQFLDGVQLDRNDPRLPKGWYATDLYTNYALQFIDEARAAQKPFLVYLAYTAPHFPVQAPAAEVAAFKGKYAKGWDVIRRETWQRQNAMHLLTDSPAPYPLTPRNPNIPAWADVPPAQKQNSQRIMETHAAAIAHVDKSIGELIARLKQQNLYDNTLILILSDNGASAEGAIPYGNYDPALPDPSGPGSDIHIGISWAELSDTPFFLYKRNTHEGGIATPLIVSYPAAIPATLNGTIARQPAHVIDIMATLVALSGATYPAKFNGHDITPMQGINLLPVWLGQKTTRPAPLYWEHENNLALRDGKWKLVKEVIEDHFQLYDMEADRTEMTDLSKSQPKIYDAMKKKLDEMFKQVGSEHMPFPPLHGVTPVYKYPR